MQGYQASLAESLDEGRPPSVRLVGAVAEQCRTWAGNGDGGWFGDLVAGYGDGGLRESLDDAARSAAGAYGSLADWLEQECAPRSAASDGAGEERYRVWARVVLGADLDVAEAYEWGTGELARLEAEKATECDRILPGAGFDAVRAHLDSAPEHGVEGVDAYQSGLQELVDEAIDALAGTEFDIDDRLRVCPVSIPPEGQRVGAVLHAADGGPRPTRTGVVPDDGPGALHDVERGDDGVPRSRSRASPPARHDPTRAPHAAPTASGSTAPTARAGRSTPSGSWTSSGWFRTPATRLGFLCMQAMRAARVVIDIGLHTGRPVPEGLPGAGGAWTYELAVDAIGRAGALPQEDATSEILRYLSWPAQATSYKLGERTWLDGRAAAMAAAGSTFDRRAWHGKALALGALGLDRLEVELAGLGAPV